LLAARELDDSDESEGLRDGDFGAWSVLAAREPDDSDESEEL
jgi:hypothetical protein